MTRETIIRAWKDPTFRDSLTPEERAALPESPSGAAMTELDDAEIASAMGGVGALLFETDELCPRTWTAPTSFTTNTHSVAFNTSAVLNLQQVVGARQF